MSKILVVYRSLSGNTENRAKAFAEGASSVSGTDVILKKTFDATLADLLGPSARRQSPSLEPEGALLHVSLHSRGLGTSPGIVQPTNLAVIGQLSSDDTL